MAKKRFESSVREGHLKRSGVRTKKSKIDFSDIPNSTPEELKRAVRIGRPTTGKAKHLIAIRIAPSLLSRIRKLAIKKQKPYQTLLHELLEEAMENKAA